VSIFTDVNTPFEVIQKALPLVPPDVLKRKWRSWQRLQKSRARAQAQMTDALAVWEQLYGRSDAQRPIQPKQEG